MNSLNSLKVLRKKVESIDQQILLLISQRQKLAPQFAKLKQQLHLPLHQPKREQELLKKYQNQAKKLNLSLKTIKQIFQLLMQSSLNQQHHFTKSKSLLKICFFHQCKKALLSAQK